MSSSGVSPWQHRTLEETGSSIAGRLASPPGAGGPSAARDRQLTPVELWWPRGMFNVVDAAGVADVDVPGDTCRQASSERTRGQERSLGGVWGNRGGDVCLLSFNVQGVEATILLTGRFFTTMSQFSVKLIRRSSGSS